MASGKSTVTFVHFALMFFVLSTVLLGVAFYMYLQDATQLTVDVKKHKSNLTKSQTARRKLDGQIQAIKKVIGHLFEEIGVDDPGNKNTVMGASAKDIKDYGGILADENYSKTLQKLRTELDKLETAVNSETAAKSDLQVELVSLKAKYQVMVDRHKSAYDDKASDNTTLVSQQKEVLDARDKRISDLADTNQQLSIEMEEQGEQHRATLKSKEDEIVALRSINERMQIQLDKTEQVSFEQEDGLIRRVDHNVGLVWISLGSADFLPRRINFSVYNKAHHGIGRGNEDIKGAIEVTRIVGPHLAEARILPGTDIHNPISSGDPIYTPLWSPGRKEQFVLAGPLDIENDGESDRALIHDLVVAAGARVVGELDEHGDRWSNKYADQEREQIIDDPVPLSQRIDVDVKFLVVGRIPDPTQQISPKEIEASKKIQRHMKRMRDEARMQGVRIVNMNDFLAYIGYVPQRRLWKPGMKVAWPLKSGAASGKVGSVVTDRSSSGRVSSVFTRSKRLKQQPTSAGQTSGSKGKY
jgi:hypothetical protein